MAMNLDYMLQLAWKNLCSVLALVVMNSAVGIDWILQAWMVVEILENACISITKCIDQKFSAVILICDC